jgi:hypothetical protein
MEKKNQIMEIKGKGKNKSNNAGTKEREGKTPPS